MAEENLKLYETIALYHPELEDASLDERSQKVEDVVAEHGGRMISVHHWKKRRLAYPVKKQEEGLYIVYRFASDKRLLSDLDYLLRYDEHCLRYLILDVARCPGMTRGKERKEEQ